MTNSNSNAKNKTGLTAWRAHNRFRIQAVALILGILSPFGLYWALQNGQTILSIVFFALFAVCMLLTFWAG
jgi:hypothetical protein